MTTGSSQDDSLARTVIQGCHAVVSPAVLHMNAERRIDWFHVVSQPVSLCDRICLPGCCQVLVIGLDIVTPVSLSSLHTISWQRSVFATSFVFCRLSRTGCSCPSRLAELYKMRSPNRTNSETTDKNSRSSNYLIYDCSDS